MENLEGIQKSKINYHDFIEHIDDLFSSINKDFFESQFERYRQFLLSLDIEYYPIGIVTQNPLWKEQLHKLFGRLTNVTHGVHGMFISEVVIFHSKYKIEDITTIEEYKNAGLYPDMFYERYPTSMVYPDKDSYKLPTIQFGVTVKLDY